ncbi:hypothetical protein JL722_13995 [Aureococcus anophagefferens]|nr:hypothetical protein JL722_13995 [Aureococcus anophagefferens]
MADPPRRRRKKEEEEIETLFDILEKAPAKEDKANASLESYSLFVGQQGSGKSSLLALLQPSVAKEAPKPTVALEYVFARRSRTTSAAKDVAHIWELGGGMGFETGRELVGVPITPARLRTAVLGIVLDLSKPHNVVYTCVHWLKILRAHVAATLDELRRDNKGKTADGLAEQARARFAERKPDKKGDKPGEHPDRRTVDPSPRADFDRREQVLRFLAHQHGATLVFTSSKDAALTKTFRNLLSYALFHKVDKSYRVEKNADKPLYVPPGGDTFDELVSAGPVDLGGLNRKELSDDAYDSLKDGAFDVDEGKSDAPDEFAEKLIDDIYAAKMDDLEKYRKKMQLKEREIELDKKRREKKKKEAAAKAAKDAAAPAAKPKARSESKRDGDARRGGGENKAEAKGESKNSAQ